MLTWWELRNRFKYVNATRFVYGHASNHFMFAHQNIHSQASYALPSKFIYKLNFCLIWRIWTRVYWPLWKSLSEFRTESRKATHTYRQLCMWCEVWELTWSNQCIRNQLQFHHAELAAVLCLCPYRLVCVSIIMSMILRMPQTAQHKICIPGDLRSFAFNGLYWPSRTRMLGRRTTYIWVFCSRVCVAAHAPIQYRAICANHWATYKIDSTANNQIFCYHANICKNNLKLSHYYTSFNARNMNSNYLLLGNFDIVMNISPLLSYLSWTFRIRAAKKLKIKMIQRNKQANHSHTNTHAQ